MKIGWSTWEPGLTSSACLSSVRVSYSCASWTSYLLNKFKEEGHDILMLQWVEDFKFRTPSIADILSVDVAVICWRWSMPDYPERHKSYRWQIELIERLGNAGVPMLIHDQDHKITDIDRKWLRQYNVTIAAPQFVLHGDYPADVSLFYCNPFEQRPPRLWGTEDIDLVYIGNNYERFDQAVRYAGPVSERYKTVFYGNWLDNGLHRESPEYVRYKLPKVIFPGRLSQTQVLDVLGNAKATIHLMKDSYAQHGFMALRWSEAAAANTIAFAPNELYLPYEYRKRFEQFRLLPKNGEELADTLEWIERNQLAPDILDLQRRFVNEFMTVDGWLETLESIYKGRR